MSDHPVRLLVVDDDEIHRLMVRRFFDAMNASGALKIAITEAKNGEEAIDILQGQAFDCILCDYRMGAVNGIEVLQYAAKNCGTAIRILLTGFASPDMEQEAEAAADVHDVLEKPMTLEDLHALIQARIVERYLMTREQR